MTRDAARESPAGAAGQPCHLLAAVRRRLGLPLARGAVDDKTKDIGAGRAGPTSPLAAVVAPPNPGAPSPSPARSRH